MNAVISRNVVSIYVSVEVQDGFRHGAEVDEIPFQFALYGSRLIRAFEVAGDVVAVLGNLHVLYDHRTVLDARGINGPIALHVDGGLLCLGGTTIQ